MKTIDHPARFLKENGILFEMNRQVLHPLGMELHLEVEDDGTLAVMELLDNRDSEAPISFTGEAYDAGRAAYEAYMDDQGRLNIKKRRRLGRVIQTGPNAHRGSDPSPAVSSDPEAEG